MQKEKPFSEKSAPTKNTNTNARYEIFFRATIFHPEKILTRDEMHVTQQS